MVCTTSIGHFKTPEFLFSAQKVTQRTSAVACTDMFGLRTVTNSSIAENITYMRFDSKKTYSYFMERWKKKGTKNMHKCEYA